MITLVDAGPLVALIDQGQGDLHKQCIEKVKGLSAPLLTTWPCFTEAMYLLGRLSGWFGQNLLWQILENRAVEIYRLSESESWRMRVLMDQYQNVPMDIADASLVVIAESTGLKQIFTLDSDFYIYRIGGRGHFEVISFSA